MNMKGKVLGYLSGAPRVSTGLDAEASGPRAHVLGVINALEATGWLVKRFIVGDRVPRNWRAGGSQRRLSGSTMRRLIGDVVRIALGMRNARRAILELGAELDVVYERFAAFTVLGRAFQRRGVPWVLETNALLYYEATTDRKSMVLSGIARRMELAAYRDADLIVVVTDALKDMIVEASGVSRSKVVVVPNGVDPAAWERDRVAPARIFGNRFTVGFVGVLSYRQGLPAALESLARVRATGRDVCLAIVGDGQMREQCLETTERLQLGAAVKFVGQVPWPEVPRYMAGFDVGFSGQIRLSNGQMYGSPLKLYEYMAMQVPVIASAFQDAATVITDGQNGFLFEPEDAAGLDSAMARAFDARAELDVIGVRARETIVKHHSWVQRVGTIMDALATARGRS